MTEEESKEAKTRRELLSEHFNDIFVKDAFKDALKLYNNSQGQIQKMLDAHKPAMEEIARQANMLAGTMKSLNTVLAREAVSGLQEKIKAMAEVMTPAPLFIKHDFSHEYEYISPRPQQIPTADEIAERVFDKIKDRMNDKPKSLKLLTSNPVIELPKEASWEDIEIKFINKFDVQVYYKGDFIKKFNYEELGFARKNTKDKLPDKQWEFLKQLALIYSNNTMQPTTENFKLELKMSKAVCMKNKEKLSDKLKGVFGIKDKPFYDYDSDKGYKAKFNLQPEPILRGTGEVYRTGAEYIDNFDDDQDEKAEDDYMN